MRPLAAILFLAAALALPAQPRHHPVVFEATVTRIDTWGPIKISCGIAIVYRLAEYSVTHSIKGRLHPGDPITVEHLACNGDELDHLKPGDHVLINAQRLNHPDLRNWNSDSRWRQVQPPPTSNGTIAIPESNTVPVNYFSDKPPQILPASH